MRLYVSLGFGILYHTTRTSANDLARCRLHFWSTTATDVHTRCLCIVAALVVHTAMYLCETKLSGQDVASKKLPGCRKGFHKQCKVFKLWRVLLLLVVMICNVTSYLGKWTQFLEF